MADIIGSHNIHDSAHTFCCCHYLVLTTKRKESILGQLFNAFPLRCGGVGIGWRAKMEKRRRRVVYGAWRRRRSLLLLWKWLLSLGGDGNRLHMKACWEKGGGRKHDREIWRGFEEDKNYPGLLSRKT